MRDAPVSLPPGSPVVEGCSPISFIFAAHCRSWYERRGGVPWISHWHKINWLLTKIPYGIFNKNAFQNERQRSCFIPFGAQESQWNRR